MKYLIYELFSGVGFCNQLFSLETSIYLANISDRKLILLIKNPLCHCGIARWEFGYLMNFFTNDFLNYLPNGFEVYYKHTNIPENIKSIMNDDKLCKTFVYSNRFSQLVFVDKQLDNDENKNDIKEFCNFRTKENLGFEENNNYEYFYINQTNASRCFYNFYTTPNNYKLMLDICKSLK
uniref:Fucosylgalactoside 3-Alpha-Galactosyltransferase n=1 Tax=Florenciella sp. virus SA2 TaxID=3240092 RepID=A0AB39JCM9_9VIRU